jgi:exodeoxyribonuclease VII small subunit
MRCRAQRHAASGFVISTVFRTSLKIAPEYTGAPITVNDLDQHDLSLTLDPTLGYRRDGLRGVRMNAKKKQEPTFEQALSELETLVERMEGGELSLEEAITTYERGVLLGKTALSALDEAQQRVQILNEGAEQAEPFEPDDS